MSDKIIIIIICIIIRSSCSNCSHSLLLVNNFIGIQKYIGGHDINSNIYSTNQLLWRLNLCIYRMCTVRFDLCVHSCKQVSGIDGEERNLSSFSLIFFSFFFFFFVLFFSFSFSLSLSLSRAEKRKSLKFSLVRTHTYIYALLIALLPIYLLSTAHRPMKFQNRRVKRAEKTTATTIEEKKERWRVSEREKERPIRWTMMMLVTERTSSDVRRTELNKRIMDDGGSGHRSG